MQGRENSPPRAAWVVARRRVATARDTLGPIPPPDVGACEEGGAVQIATWNVNGLRARVDYIKLWLAEREPDVVGFQELKMEDDKFPHDAFEDLGYRCVTHGQKSWNGVAILSRLPVEHVESGLPGQADFGSRLIRARVGEGNAAVDFTTLYCPNGKSTDHDDFPKKLDWFDALRDWAKGFVDSGTATILCGDFNIVPTALDTWDEESFVGSIFHTDEERARLAAVLDVGLRDLYREVEPDTQAFSWWDYRGGAFHRKHGLRIDFLLGTEAVVSRLRGVEIDRDFRKKKEGLTASDHAPVIATLDD